MSTPPLAARPSDSRAHLPRLTVRGKILTLVAFFAVVAVALGGVAAVQITQITGDAARLARTQATVGTSLTALKDSLWTVRNQVTAVAAYPPSAQKTQVDKLTAAYQALDTSERAFVDAFTTSEGAAPDHWAGFVDALAAYRKVVDGDLMDAALSGNQTAWARVRDSSGSRSSPGSRSRPTCSH